MVNSLPGIPTYNVYTITYVAHFAKLFLNSSETDLHINVQQMSSHKNYSLYLLMQFIKIVI